MPVPLTTPHQIVLTIDERAALMALTRPTVQARMLLRARIVLAAAEGGSNAGIARDLGICEDTVRKWRCRYALRGLGGLADAPRPGRPRRFSPVARAQVTAIACELPALRGMPLSRWSSSELAYETIEAGVVDDISPSTVRRWLAADAIKPWQYRSWIAPRAPDFASKAAVVLDLYARVFDGQGVLDRGQRLVPPRPDRDRPDAQSLAYRPNGAHPGTRELVESVRDLLLRRAA